MGGGGRGEGASVREKGRGEVEERTGDWGRGEVRSEKRGEKNVRGIGEGGREK